MSKRQQQALIFKNIIIMFLNIKLQKDLGLLNAINRNYVNI